MSQILHDLISVEIPEGLLIVTEEEKKQFFSIQAGDDSWALRNEEQHTIFAVCWKKRPLLVGRLASLDAHLEATEKIIKKRTPSYENIGRRNRVISGINMSAFTCKYKIGDITQYGEYDLCIIGKYFCSIQNIYREGFQDFAQSKFEEFINGIKLL